MLIKWLFEPVKITRAKLILVLSTILLLSLVLVIWLCYQFHLDGLERNIQILIEDYSNR